MITLKEAREKRGIKQNAVANAIKVSRQTYAKFEDNPRLMTVGQAEAACVFMGYDVSEIFFGEESSKT